MIRHITFITIIGFVVSCNLQANNTNTEQNIINFRPHVSLVDSTEIVEFQKTIKIDKTISKTLGSVSKGSLTNGKLVPFYGPNYTYFDKDSYIGYRAFTSDKVRTIVIEAYSDLQSKFPNRHFFLMELSNQKGGKMFPHKTHQNGLSVDFMMPKLKDKKPEYSLDTIGKEHYWLEFTDDGEYISDLTIKIDFEVIALHILLLEKRAQSLGLKISKVIIKIEYKDELYAGPYGQELKKSGIYVVKNLSPLINRLHDDHFHVDFEKR